jgi:hypothetical protein
VRWRKSSESVNGRGRPRADRCDGFRSCAGFDGPGFDCRRNRPADGQQRAATIGRRLLSAQTMPLQSPYRTLRQNAHFNHVKNKIHLHTASSPVCLLFFNSIILKSLKKKTPKKPKNKLIR